MGLVTEDTNVFAELLNPAVLTNPYPFYADLRGHFPVFRSKAMPALFFTRHTDLQNIFKDNRFSNRWVDYFRMGRPLDPSEQAVTTRILDFFRMWMQANDEPQHSRIRGLVHQAFTPRSIAEMKTRIEATAHHLLDQVIDHGRMDLLRDFARPLPANVMADMLGLPEDNREQFVRGSEAVMAFLGMVAPAPGQLEAIETELNALVTMLGEVVRKRRELPTNDLISAMIAVRETADRLSDAEVVTNCIVLLAAGHESTTNLIANGLVALLKHPDELTKLTHDSELMGSAVEEMLRYDTPAQWVPRVARTSFEYGGVKLSEGDFVWLGIGAANRDPDQFSNPDRFDVARVQERGLSFGRGPHFCLGAALARLEAEVAFRVLLGRVRDIRLEADVLHYIPNFTLRALTELPIAFQRRHEGATR